MNIHDFIGIEDIKDGLIKIHGNRYRTVVTASPVNFALLSEREQESIENSFGKLLMSLSYPVQILTLTKPVEIKDSVLEFRKHLKDIPGTMIEYESQLEQFLYNFASQTLVTESYIIIPFDDYTESYDKARSELMRRTYSVIEGLSNCGLSPKVLSTDELIDFVYAFFHRDSKLKATDLIEWGSLELFKKGVMPDAEAFKKK